MKFIHDCIPVQCTKVFEISNVNAVNLKMRPRTKLTTSMLANKLLQQNSKTVVPNKAGPQKEKERPYITENYSPSGHHRQESNESTTKA